MKKVKITIESAENVAPITELNEVLTTENEARAHALKCFERIGLNENTKAIKEGKNISYFGKVENANRWVKIERIEESEAKAKVRKTLKKDLN